LSPVSDDVVPAFGEAMLTDCDREPIHIPGAIQPHGVLLVLSEPDLIIVQASANMRQHLQLAAERMVGKAVSLIFDEAAMAAIRQVLTEPLVEPHYLPPLNTATGTRKEAVIHRTDAGLLLELEPVMWTPDAVDIPQLFRRMLSAVHAAASLPDACNEAVRWLREIIGFDRVMVYRFEENGDGSVIAEDRRADWPSFLGQHYPASDIPVQARRLFQLNPMRIWVGTTTPTVGLVPPVHPGTGTALDMSRCFLRAASPIHLEYLRNMGVGASMTLSVILDGELWGLIACHHETSRQVPHSQRIVLESLGHLLGLQIETKTREARSQEMGRLHTWIVEALKELQDGQAPFTEIAALGGKLLDFVAADGVAVHIGGRTSSIGKTPNPAEITNLAHEVFAASPDGVLATHALDERFGVLRAVDGSTLCGILVVTASRRKDDCIIWFRQEIAKTVTWAGDPSAGVAIGPSGKRVTPRGSFEAWIDSVKGQSQPWTMPEVEAAHTLHLALLEFSGRWPPPDLPAPVVPPALVAGEAALRVADAIAAARRANEAMGQLLTSLERLADGLRR
jgi:chemotaxis family two-component system sensor kinase Cph1